MILIKDRHYHRRLLRPSLILGNYDTYKGSTPITGATAPNVTIRGTMILIKDRHNHQSVSISHILDMGTMILIKDRHLYTTILAVPSVSGNYDTYKGSTLVSVLRKYLSPASGNYDTYKGSTLNLISVVWISLDWEL